MPKSMTADLHPAAGARIVLIRHGQPDIALRPRTGHAAFQTYIADYDAAGLDRGSLPPEELADLAREVTHVFTSGKACADESARRLAPHAELIMDPLFVEAPLASPRIPILRMTVVKWAVVARLLWHAGFHPDIENYSGARARAIKAADILTARVKNGGITALVAHGYFNAMIGRQLRLRGWVRQGKHRARYWNAVTYEWNKGKQT